MIRPAETDELDKIADLYVYNHKETYKGLLPVSYFDALTPAYAKEKWRNYLQNPENRIWAAYDGDRFLGFSAGAADPDIPDTWLLDSLHVSKNARGKGIGTSLIRMNGAHAVKAGFSKMSICIVRGNERARSLYLKLGAVHFLYFDDSFGSTVSHSEKLIWNDLTFFNKHMYMV